MKGPVSLFTDFVNISDTSVRVVNQPLNEYVFENDHLGLEDRDAYFVADLGDVVKKIHLWKKHLPRIKPFYAVKCNNDPVVLGLLEKYGLGYDCASKAEMQQILQMGVSASRIIYAHPCKLRSHLKAAANNDVSLMTFDNECELYKIKNIFPHARCVLRLLPPDESGAQCPLGMKFGCEATQAPRLLEVARKLQLNIVGVSFHVGSGCTNAKAFSSAVKVAREVFDIAEQMEFNMTLLDIGGGFPGQPGMPVSFEEICEELNPVLDELFPEKSGVELIAEPGRFFVASAFTLAVSIMNRREEIQEQPSSTTIETSNAVTAVEQSSEVITGKQLSQPNKYRYYVNDGVYGCFNNLLFDHALVTPVKTTEYMMGVLYKSSVWGPTCDSMDCIHKSVLLPLLHPNDYLMYGNMGAYTLTAASPFNGMEPPHRYYMFNEQQWDPVMFPPIRSSESGLDSAAVDSGIDTACCSSSCSSTTDSDVVALGELV